MQELYVVESIDEDKYVKLENLNDKKVTKILQLSALPFTIKENDILEYKDHEWILQKEKTELRKKEIQNKFERLLKK